ncbi:type II toxin-antitoxin system prevent-host-death family antitoxin [Candidatus Leptofilum sp.]|uniref:type II toxin-antitoxin system prevent-host-death family antitoxin n=1 Tax=Candidatus Leptofilum sp. TaxID=3241576 RepID=UPI003B595D41
MMQTITATNAKNELLDLLRATIREHKQYRIASEEGGAVLLSEEEYESLLETVELLSQPGLYESIKQADLEIKDGDTLSMDDVFGEE